ncbi:hypothetical protein JCM19037_189 [Geomicrobium sp. JCM 19037]|nr:hypothetical protein JCM19037_189 [Geomicrobium sp. JCM 19037]
MVVLSPAFIISSFVHFAKKNTNIYSFFSWRTHEQAETPSVSKIEKRTSDYIGQTSTTSENWRVHRP